MVRMHERVSVSPPFERFYDIHSITFLLYTLKMVILRLKKIYAKKNGCQILPSWRPLEKVVLSGTPLLKTVQYDRTFLRPVQYDRIFLDSVQFGNLLNVFINAI